MADGPGRPVRDRRAGSPLGAGLARVGAAVVGGRFHGVEAEAADVDEGVPRIGVDRDVAAGAGLAVGLKFGRVLGVVAAQYASRIEHVGDRRGAVISWL